MDKNKFTEYKTLFEATTGKKESEYSLSDLLAYIGILKSDELRTTIQHCSDTIISRMR